MEILKQYLKAATFGMLLLQHGFYTQPGLVKDGGMIFYH